jgi:hypothetical protein
MFYKIGDTVVLQDLDYFQNYNGKEFIIIDVYLEKIYQVKADGFDPIWVTEKNFAKGE